MRIYSVFLGAILAVVVAPVITQAQTTEPAPASTQPLTKTVGIDIIKKTVNPDGSLTLLFQWKDKDKKLVSRSVIVNDGTVIGIDGQLKTMADISDAVLKKKAVATVGPDMVTAVNLQLRPGDD